MQRYKTFDSSGVAPNGKLFAGDINAIQDAAAGLTDLAQHLSVADIAIGEAGLLLSRFGAGEATLSGKMRVAGYIRAGGVYPGEYTTAARDAIAVGARPGRLIIYNTTNARYEYNAGTDAAPSWSPLAPALGSNSITAAELAPDSVGASELAPDSVANENIIANAVTIVGVIASRPSAASVKSGTGYVATDQNNILYVSDGATWRTIGPSIAANSITAAELGADSVGASELGLDSVGNENIIDNAVTIVGTFASRPAATSVAVGTLFVATDQGFTRYASDGSTWQYLGQRDVCSYQDSRTSGQTITATAPSAGTYIVAYGIGKFDDGGQGSTGTLQTNVTGTAVAQASTVSGDGGSVHFPGVVLTAGQVVTATASISSGTLRYCWLHLIRTA